MRGAFTRVLWPALRWAWRVATTTWFLGVALFVITWPVPSLVPQPGLDFSFVAGLHMATHEHLHFGTQIVATYGPLGFLRYPFLYYTWTAGLALLYTGGIHLLLCLTLVWALRRMLPALIAVPIAWVCVAIIAMQPESALVVVVIWLIEFMRSDSAPWLKRWFPILAGAIGGVEVLIKLNTGVTIAVLAALALLIGGRREWRQRIVSFAGSFAVSFLIAWLATGQSIDNVGPYVSTAREIVSGWSTAMQYLGPRYQLWAALVAAIAVFVIAWQSTKLERLSARAGILLIWLLLGFSVFKEGFVGQSAGHEAIYFSTALGAVIAFGWPGTQRLSVLWGLTLLVVLSFAISQGDPGRLLDPRASERALRSQVSTMLSVAKRGKLMADARAAMNSSYSLDATTLNELRGRSVDIVPSEQGILWANNLRWTPIPIYQFYYALTPALDELNAHMLASASGPERLLRNISAPINERNNLFDSPAAQRSMLCHYAPISTTAAYQVLTRVADRCGKPQLIETSRARWQQWVSVPKPPAPDELIYVRVSGAAPHGLEGLRGLLWRSYMRAIGLKEGATGPARDFSIVPDTVADGLLMSIPVQADFLAPFSLDPQATQLALGTSSGSLAAVLTYRFYAEKITPTAAAVAFGSA